MLPWDGLPCNEIILSPEKTAAPSFIFLQYHMHGHKQQDSNGWNHLLIAVAFSVQAHEGIEQLKLNLKKEHDLKVDWMTAIFAHVRPHLAPLSQTVPCLRTEPVLATGAFLQKAASPDALACFFLCGRKKPQHVHVRAVQYIP